LSFPVQEFKARRDSLLASMSEGIAIVPTAVEAVRNGDSHYPYRFDSYFYYLTGFKEPESLLVLVAGNQPKTILFCRDKDMEREIWDGFRYGPQAAQDVFGFDEAYSISQLNEMMPKLLSNQSKLFYSLGGRHCVGYESDAVGKSSQRFGQDWYFCAGSHVGRASVD
jgi:Xaa-Pro aminopeptidase